MVKQNKKKLNLKKRSTMRRKQRGGQKFRSEKYTNINGETVQMYFANPSELLKSKDLGFKIFEDQPHVALRPVVSSDKLENAYNYVFVKKSSDLNSEDEDKIKKFLVDSNSDYVSKK